MASTGLTRGMPWLRQFMGQRAMSFAATRPLQKAENEAHQSIKEACTEVKKTAKDVREKVNDAADKVIDKAFDNAPKAVATAQEIGGKVKERAQDALSSAKNTK
ncbi:uncharacterized protein LOC109835889 [Asparagus officinalis]|uniref:uncharacterized protein LOC109835889 n=1 Tax=Asparagus officinalis TaxID=4686 RepID=UPI00098E0215|nr:uncharacterized protein LOC109835889 [Asparagus officinalis]